MEPNRKLWNDGQRKLRIGLSAASPLAVKLFLTQHAMVHSKKMSRMDVWSFEDELWQGLTDGHFRAIPPKGEHSIAWILFHITRIEDMTMNVLAADSPQLYLRDGWAKKLRSGIDHSGNRMDAEAVTQLTEKLDLPALREYRTAVGRRTREIVKKLKAETWNQKVEPLRLQTLLNEGAVIPQAMEIIHYWGKRTVAGLLLMPPTRHNFLHLNEAMRIKIKLTKAGY